jgi:hypothetical protein
MERNASYSSYFLNPAAPQLSMNKNSSVFGPPVFGGSAFKPTGFGGGGGGSST